MSSICTQSVTARCKAKVARTGSRCSAQHQASGCGAWYRHAFSNAHVPCLKPCKACQKRHIATHARRRAETADVQDRDQFKEGWWDEQQDGQQHESLQSWDAWNDHLDDEDNASSTQGEWDSPTSFADIDDAAPPYYDAAHSPGTPLTSFQDPSFDEPSFSEDPDFNSDDSPPPVSPDSAPVVAIDETDPKRIPFHHKLHAAAAAADPERCKATLSSMEAVDLVPGAAARHVLCFAHVKAGDMDAALEVAKDAFRAGVEVLEETYMLLVFGFVEADDVKRAEAVMKSMYNAGRDSSLGWLTLTKGLFRRGHTDAALDHLGLGLHEGWNPDASLYMLVLRAYCDRGNTMQARQILATMSNLGVQPAMSHCNVVVQAIAEHEGTSAAMAFIQSGFSTSVDGDDGSQDEDEETDEHNPPVPIANPNGASYTCILRGSLRRYLAAQDAQDADPELDEDEDALVIGDHEVDASEDDGEEEEEAITAELFSPTEPDESEETLSQVVHGLREAMDSVPVPVGPEFMGLSVKAYLLEDDTMLALQQVVALREVLAGVDWVRFIDPADLARLFLGLASSGKPKEIVSIISEVQRSGGQLDDSVLVDTGIDYDGHDCSPLTAWFAPHVARLGEGDNAERILTDYARELLDGNSAEDFDGELRSVDYVGDRQEDSGLLGICNCIVDDSGVPIPVPRMRKAMLVAELEARGSDPTGKAGELRERVKLQRKVLQGRIDTWFEGDVGRQKAHGTAVMKDIMDREGVDTKSALELMNERAVEEVRELNREGVEQGDENVMTEDDLKQFFYGIEENKYAHLYGAKYEVVQYKEFELVQHNVLTYSELEASEQRMAQKLSDSKRATLAEAREVEGAKLDSDFEDIQDTLEQEVSEGRASVESSLFAELDAPEDLHSAPILTGGMDAAGSMHPSYDDPDVLDEPGSDVDGEAGTSDVDHGTEEASDDETDVSNDPASESFDLAGDIDKFVEDDMSVNDSTRAEDDARQVAVRDSDKVQSCERPLDLTRYTNETAGIDVAMEALRVARACQLNIPWGDLLLVLRAAEVLEDVQKLKLLHKWATEQAAVIAEALSDAPRDTVEQVSEIDHALEQVQSLVEGITDRVAAALNGCGHTNDAAVILEEASEDEGVETERDAVLETVGHVGEQEGFKS